MVGFIFLGAKEMQLKERDKKVLELGYEQRVLSLGQVERYVFKEMAGRTARRCITRLERLELIRRDYNLQFRGRRLIHLSRKGVATVRAARSLPIPQGRKFDLRTLGHDGYVTAVRLRLEEMWSGYWVPEALLKAREFPQIPDGLWVFPNGHRVAIEVENSEKGSKRFNRLQARWKGVDIRLVLYVAVGPALHGTLKRYMSTGPKDLPFGLVEFSAIEAGTPKVWTVARELELLSRKQF